MNRVLKTLLLWLMIAALPVQAIAAVMNASCDPAHPPVAQAADRHAHEAAAQEACDCQHDASDTRHNNASCNAGAACCAGAVAPPSAVLPVTLYKDTETVTLSPAVLSSGYVPARPKRPPRPTIA